MLRALSSSSSIHIYTTHERPSGGILRTPALKLRCCQRFNPRERQYRFNVLWLVFVNSAAVAIGSLFIVATRFLVWDRRSAFVGTGRPATSAHPARSLAKTSRLVRCCLWLGTLVVQEDGFVGAELFLLARCTRWDDCLCRTGSTAVAWQRVVGIGREVGLLEGVRVVKAGLCSLLSRTPT